MRHLSEKRDLAARTSGQSLSELASGVCETTMIPPHQAQQVVERPIQGLTAAVVVRTLAGNPLIPLDARIKTITALFHDIVPSSDDFLDQKRCELAFENE